MFKNVVIDSYSYIDPKIFLTSEEFEAKLSSVYERLKLPFGRLELQTSIKSRGMWQSGTRPSDISSMAAKKLLKDNNIDPKSIDLLIHSSVCRDFLEPSTSSYIHNNLDLSPHCISYDLSNACLGFVNAMDLAAKQIEAGFIKKALIVTGENSGPLIEQTIKRLNEDTSITRKSIKKFFANLTIGSAGCAFLLTHKDLSSSSITIDNSLSLTDSKSSNLCQGNGSIDNLMMETDSTTLLHAGVELASKTWMDYKSNFNIDNDHFSHFITHQVGIAHTALLFDKLEIDINKNHYTFFKYGNTGSAAVPLTFIKAMENSKISKGQKVCLMGIGSGLHSIMMGITC
ncbi:MAG: 3-oxoacyl-ACP synthase III [Bacteriovoracaceae bacterium]|jgi:3-oxoacyl-[acyl-carrier-protein] synthase-3|nr:3-oxoacyl-ACP synthase III [Bacteriovoracaceae bacterium]